MKSFLRTISTAVFGFTATAFFAQPGRIQGTIVDGKTGETLPGATILIEGTTKGAAADLDGKFSINNVAEGKYTLVASYVSYAEKKFAGVVVKKSEVTVVNVMLQTDEGQALEEVQVVTTLNRENNTALVLQQKNNASLSDGISAETIRRTPDRNTGDVLKRVSGVTIQDDKFVVVRGLNERYNASYLNGAPLPSTEPDRKAFAFDLFPANMLDNLVINKTATPDMPAEFAGGIVQVNTKSIPEKNFVLVSAGTGMNSITTGRDKIVYPGGKLDNLGFDDGSRNMPASIPPFSDKSKWNTRQGKADMAAKFNNDWGYSNSKFGPNSIYQVATGYNIKRKDRDFAGVIFSLSNYRNQSFNNFHRTEYEGLDAIHVTPETVEKDIDFDTRIYQDVAATGGLLNLSLKPSENHTFTWRNMLCGATDNRFLLVDGTNNYREDNIPLNRRTNEYFAANKIFSSQLNGEHYLPAAKLKLSWVASASDIHRTVPNLRFMSYSKLSYVSPDYDQSIGPNVKDTMYKADISTSVGPNYAGFRVYSDLTERLASGRFDASRTLKVNSSLKIDVKAGVMLQDRDRNFVMRSFGMVKGPSLTDSLGYLPADQIFAAQNMTVDANGKSNYQLVEYTKDDDNYHAHSSLSAAYGMAEVRYAEKLRVIAGVRQETYAQHLDVNFYYPREFDSTYVDNTVRDILPSVNVVYNLTGKAAIRAAYYETVNRPEFREMAKVIWFDPETRISVTGNPDLKRCRIRNGDLRFELYPGMGQLFTVTGFYKYFENPIERYMYKNNTQLIVYNNVNYGIVNGLELEYRINAAAILKKDSVAFLRNLSVFSNFALIKSVVNVKGIEEGLPETRPMQGQSPYIINGGITYNDPKRAWGITCMVNRVGHRLYIVGSSLIPNRWENGRTVVDLMLTKNFFSNRLELRLTARDLLQQNWIVYYKGSDRASNANDPSVDYLNFSRNFGSTYSFQLTYRF